MNKELQDLMAYLDSNPQNGRKVLNVARFEAVALCDFELAAVIRAAEMTFPESGKYVKPVSSVKLDPLTSKIYTTCDSQHNDDWQ